MATTAELTPFIHRLTAAGCLLDKDAADQLTEKHVNHILSLEEKPLVVDVGYLEGLAAEKPGAIHPSPIETSFEIIKSVDEQDGGKAIQDFVEYFSDRYHQISSFLRQRRPFRRSVSLSNIVEGKEIAIIGMVENLRPIKNDRVIATLEDPSGTVKVLVPNRYAGLLVTDEVVGVLGNMGSELFYAEEVVWPDVPLSKATNIVKTNESVQACFLSDIHAGSKDFLKNKLDSFLSWLTSDKDAQRIGYFFIAGDLVDGIGIYPGQKEDLEIADAYAQYDFMSEYLSQIPDRIQVFLTPGNHDMVRLAEPQPPLPPSLFSACATQKNIHSLSNPSWIKVHAHDPGGSPIVMMYHGYSFDRHVDMLPHLRGIAYAQPILAMVDYLRRRHLAPSYQSTLLSPTHTDHLVIDPVPDVFVMGHIHSFATGNYKGITLINSSTLQGQTDFQRRMGHKPDPGMVSVLDLSTRKMAVKLL